ncbi:phosphoglycerate dehydrogenase [Helicobacter monodelphidis]|uniref:phosphoglycerate dehydrogenase n=1 Tax=Helicobacter sp. 15-1451 TaxID=2004995 RepID=UPI000DCF510B|nr:phosphoglycerate dehydrogenase [Helicobacter sp. 15-1451]RAX58855.1 phosphoglycerate dehydrogenase [Helicobacter sp. 15-1451]
MPYKIVVCDHIHAHGLDILKKSSEVDLIEVADHPKDRLAEVLSGADVAITRSSTDVDSAFLAAATGIKAIVRAGVGVDNVDIDACSRSGVVVMNVPTANTIAAVELTMAHLLNAVRNFPGANHQLKNDRIWKREDWYGTELKGKKLGIIGFGNIGSRVGLRAKAFEMEVITYDPYIKPAKATDLGVGYVTDFNAILECDIITIHTPKNRETINMINKEQIEKMKDGVILINCARGGLYNEEALLEGLKSKKIRWAGVDVFNKEPAIQNPLLDVPNLYVTPHIGANTLESQERIAIEAAEAAIEAARGSSFPNALNLPIKENELPSSLKPFLELIQKMGFLATQINKNPIHSIQLTLEGELRSYSAPLQTSLLVGALKASLGDAINYVNAPFVSEERGIKCKVDCKEAHGAYQNVVSIKLTSETETITLSGSVFDGSIQRIVEVNGFYLDIKPKGRMIFFRNTDVPGVIGAIGTILANHQINIADFRLGRNAHNEALAVIIVDDEVNQATLQELRNIKACLNIAYAVI